MNRNRAGQLVKRCGYLSMAEKLVFLSLLEGADNSDCAVPERMTPSVAMLADWTSLNRATVFRALSHMQLHGWLERESGDGRGHKSRYSLVARQPDDDCSCPKRVAQVHPSDSVDDSQKGRTGRLEGSHRTTQRVAQRPEFSQVITASARRDAGMKGVVGMHEDKQEAEMASSNRAAESAAARARIRAANGNDKPCDQCGDAPSRIHGASRLCRVHHPIWTEAA